MFSSAMMQSKYMTWHTYLRFMSQQPGKQHTWGNEELIQTFSHKMSTEMTAW
jgi:hypothetical protein